LGIDFASWHARCKYHVVTNEEDDDHGEQVTVCLPGGEADPRTDATNAEGAPAYAFAPEHRLAQIAMTGTFSQSSCHSCRRDRLFA
jgi:hypothetical protein